MRENRLIRNTLITPGACFCTSIRHVRENKGHLHIWNTLITPFVHTARKGHLLIQNTLITPDDCFVRENKGHLLIRNTLITPLYIYTACDGK